MSQHRQSGPWMLLVLVSLALLCAVTVHRRFLPFPESAAPGRWAAHAHVSTPSHEGDAPELSPVETAGEGVKSLVSASVDLSKSLSRIRVAMMRAHVQELED